MDQPPGHGGSGQVAIIHEQGEHWTLVYNNQVSHLRVTRGLQLLQWLLLRPGEAIPALHLEHLTEVESASRRIGPLANERARTNVSRALSNVLERIRPAHRDLYLHLRATLRAGTVCKYEPDMSVPIRWRSR